MRSQTEGSLSLPRRAEVRAFEEEATSFANAHFKSIAAAVGLYCGDTALGQEAAQEALARAWANWRKVRLLERPDAWAYKVAVNYCASVFRRRRLAAARAHQTSLPVEMESGDRGVLDRVTLDRVLQRLGKRERTALVGRYFLDLSYSQLAETMGVAEGTAKSLVRRGLARVRGFVDLKEEELS